MTDRTFAPSIKLNFRESMKRLAATITREYWEPAFDVLPESYGRHLVVFNDGNVRIDEMEKNNFYSPDFSSTIAFCAPIPDELAPDRLREYMTSVEMDDEIDFSGVEEVSKTHPDEAVEEFFGDHPEAILHIKEDEFEAIAERIRANYKDLGVYIPTVDGYDGLEAALCSLQAKMEREENNEKEAA